MNPSRTTFLSSGIAVILLLGYMLAPITDSAWEIEEDMNKVLIKEAYLNKLQNFEEASINKPNIVLIVADDLGVSDVSIGGNVKISTPQIDQIAKDGIHFKNAYCSSPICATSRAALLTGRYQNRFGFENQMQRRYPKNRMELFVAKNFMDTYPWSIKWTSSTPTEENMDRQGLPISEITIAEILKYGANYNTACIGKWHLGSSEGKKPNDFGFDYHYGFYNSHSLYVPEGKEGFIDQKIKKDWTDQFIWESQRDGTSAIVKNDQIIKENFYLTDRIADESIDFIKRNENHPFFLYVPFSAPHTPLQAPKKLYEKLAHINDPVERAYYTMIASLDEAVGRIMKTLDELDLSDNTIVFLISDNGGAHYTLTTENVPYKGGKVTQFEGGLRIPFYVKWGDRFNGEESEARVSTLDIYRTIAELAEIPLIEDRTIDGINLLEKNSNEELNSRSLHWKVGESHAIINKHHKLIFTEGEKKSMRLYNLDIDPTERKNLSNQESDKIEELIRLQKEWSKDLPTPLWPGVIRFIEKDDGESLYFES